MLSHVYRIIGTFFLMLVIIGMAADKKVNPGVYGLSISMPIAISLTFLGPITGEYINPIYGFSPYVVNFLVGNLAGLVWSNYLIFLIGPIIAGIISVLAYKFIESSNSDESSA